MLEYRRIDRRLERLERERDERRALARRDARQADAFGRTPAEQLADAEFAITEGQERLRELLEALATARATHAGTPAGRSTLR